VLCESVPCLLECLQKKVRKGRGMREEEEEEEEEEER